MKLKSHGVALGPRLTLLVAQNGLNSSRPSSFSLLVTGITGMRHPALLSVSNLSLLSVRIDDPPKRSSTKYLNAMSI